ncbi:uncharacterized protein LOC133663056 [Entelurus aequoreus]|uniref:uncharacterized protein LOC133663056 n=1 Tax=Entelurus aequoreus TaxID=161455 RepID=UPI002B1CF6C2|nr:uncharacterized protein LOC133663056 [Entelurus aequoreus]
MKTVFPHFHQYVNFATRGGSRLDLVHSNIKQAYKAAPRPHLGSSDHLSVMLIPAFKPMLIRKPATVKQVRTWPERAMSALQDCFETTDWDMFKAAATKNHPTCVEEYAESVFAYIQKCMEDVSVIKNIPTRANEKPWLNSENCHGASACRCAFINEPRGAHLRTSPQPLISCTRHSGSSSSCNQSALSAPVVDDLPGLLKPVQTCFPGQNVITCSSTSAFVPHDELCVLSPLCFSPLVHWLPLGS